MKDLNSFTELYDEIFNELEALATRIGLMLERKVVEVIEERNRATGQLVATGDMLKSITSDIEKQTDLILVKVFGSVKHTIFAHEDTRPHFPPIEPIARWVKQKKIGASYSIKSHKPLTMTESRIRSIAFLIARSISRKGTKGYKFFDIALKQSQTIIDNEISKFNLQGA